MAKRMGLGEGGTAAPSGKPPARKSMATGRLLGFALIGLLIVVAGYLVWMFMSVKGPGSAESAEKYWTEERMAIQAYQHGFKEDLQTLNEKRKKEGKPPIPLPKLPPAMERRGGRR